MFAATSTELLLGNMPRSAARRTPRRRHCACVLRCVWLVAALLAAVPHPARGFPAVGDFNSAEVPVAARRWVLSAAARNNSNAQLALADYLYFAPRRFAEDSSDDGIASSVRENGDNGGGDGGDGGGGDDDNTPRRVRRRRRAALWYARAAAQGVPAAQGMLAAFYSMGLHGFPRDEGRAVLYHTLAAAGGLADSKLALAYRHLRGIGVPRSCSAAAELYVRRPSPCMDMCSTVRRSLPTVAVAHSGFVQRPPPFQSLNVPPH